VPEGNHVLNLCQKSRTNSIPHQDEYIRLAPRGGILELMDEHKKAETKLTYQTHPWLIDHSFYRLHQESLLTRAYGYVV